MRVGWHVARAGLVILLGSTMLNAGGCSLVVEKEIEGKGFGSTCTSNGDCHAGVCEQNLCTAKCTGDADCPSPTKCVQKTGYCASPLHAGFMYVGVLEDQGWSYMQDQGRKAAQDALPYLTTDFALNVITDDDVNRTAREMIAKGANVILQTSQGGTAPMGKLAQEFPGVTFLQLYNRTVSPPNLGSYWVKLQQSWYIAGYVAAKKSKTNRIAWIGGYVSPQGVVRANGFIRGARRANPNIKVDIRWVGFWFDPSINPPKYREILLTEQALDAGADVVIGNIDNERPYDVVKQRREQNKDVWSIETNNPASCEKYKDSCLGVAWLNWAPIYIDQLDQIHRKTWTPSYVHRGMAADKTQSPVGFTPSDQNLTDTNIRLEIANMMSDFAKDPEAPLRGPYNISGAQREPVGDGEVISEDELLKMCWFPEGAIEKRNPDDPTSEDIPATVPVGDKTFLKKQYLSAANQGLADPPDCRKNL
ncbi:BMP family ABC transporter substrate-binding protein [Pendulispora brunnea]|uniref:BMP family ABC transporter substrate-binding protein n=1 Tax=Pendulispora brunnea TaxID=2905690 RepID=A0ABZ2K855_9BACT